MIATVVRSALTLLVLAVVVFTPAVYSPLETSADAGFTIANPYTGGLPYKGQLHFHTNDSLPAGTDDGSFSTGVMMWNYRDFGFDFAMPTPHDGIAPQTGIGGILQLPGIEESTTDEAVHVTALWASANLPLGSPAQVVSAIKAAGGLAVASHPNFTLVDWTEAEIDSADIDMVEVFNNSCPESFAEDKWDYAMRTKPYPVWGVAVDDAHLETTQGKGWVVVYAPALTGENIKAALKAGNFYSTHGAFEAREGGPRIEGPSVTVRVSGNTITAATDRPATIIFKRDGNAVVASRPFTLSSSYRVSGDERFVRVVVQRHSDGRQAWSQPLYINR